MSQWRPVARASGGSWLIAGVQRMREARRANGIVSTSKSAGGLLLPFSGGLAGFFNKGLSRPLIVGGNNKLMR